MKRGYLFNLVWRAKRMDTKKSYSKFSILFLFVLFSIIGFNAKAQYTVIVGPSTSTGTSYSHGPVFRSSSNSTYFYSMFSYVYTAAEMASAGISAGNRIDSIKFKLNTAAVLKNPNKLAVEVWLQNSTASNLTSGTTWGSTTSGSTQKMSTTWNYTNPGGAGWVSMKFNSGFIYNGGSLIVSVRTSLSGSFTQPFSSSAFTWDVYSGSAIPSVASIGIASNNVLNSNTTLNTGAYGGNTRPLTQMVYTIMGSGCSGTPSPGNTISSVTSACPNVSFDLNLQNATPGAGVTYQWQSASNSSFTANLTNLGTNPTQTISQTATRFYRCKVTCSGTSTYSNPVQVGMNAGMSCYCIPGSSSNNTYIASVKTTLGGQNITNTTNAVSPGGYGDFFNSFSVSKSQGGTVNFNITTTTLTSGLKIWADWNQDGDFEDSDEEVFVSTSFAYIHTGSFQVPMSATLGDTRIRFGAALSPVSGPSSSCETTINGEFEDYKFTVLPAIACAGSPTAGTASAVSTVCINTSFNLNVTGSTGGGGINGIWQQSLDGGNTWSNIVASANNTSYLVSGITQNTSYRYVNTCTNTNQSSISNTINVGIYNFNYAIYNGISFFEGFENWVSGCSSTDRPSNSWINNPVSGNNSWRRNDEGANGGWSNISTGVYSPASNQGTASARFHSSTADDGHIGSLNFFLDMTNAAGSTRLDFDHINVSGTDVVKVWLSIDGGLSFSQLGNDIGVSSIWTQKTFNFSSTSAKTIIKIEAISDKGSSDIGIDNFQLSPGSTTPIVLEYFKGKTKDFTNVLDWKAGVEQNANMYVVERSSNGLEFSELGNVKAENMNGAMYQFKDTHPLNGENIYRLRLESFDRMPSYSNIVKLTVNVNDGLAFSVVPNPIKENIKVNIQGDIQKDASISIVDVLGRVVYQQQVNQSEFTIDMSSFKPGIYLIQFNDKSIKKVIKVVKE